MDVVFSNGVLHHTPDIKKSLREAFRVLKPNGEFWIILYHKHSIFHWLSVVLFDYILTLKFLSLSYQERLSIIEYTTSRERPLVRLYSRNQISSLLRNTGFRLDKCLVRKLGPEDFPSIFILKKVWNILPLWFLSVLGKAFGWYVIVRGVKPERSS
jgi:SAM-dependent methyltransferase